MSTPTVTSVLSSIATAAVASASSTAVSRVTPQGGIIEGIKPNEYSASDPIKTFIIQAGIIIIMCRLLHYPLSLLGQPRVIAEVIGGILLGPSVLSRIPGFKDAIFPAASIPVLSAIANLGLILFLFLIALELDMRLFTSNWRVALSVGFAGMVLPFGLGCAIAYGLYHQFRDDEGTIPISFSVYALFVGTALAITAFPVLCRILTELNLLGSSVGVTVLAAGVGNDVVGWILLALCVALVNQSSGLAALWVLLACIGWILLLVFGIRPILLLALRRSGSLENGPTQGMVALTLLLVLTSAWFTGIIGVHAIFGGFLVGLICPHDGGFAIKLTEKIEDLVTVLFLPLYFALSGLNTNIGLLNDGLSWGYVVAIVVIAFAGKMIGGTLAARSMKLVWRESLTIGVLMSCKGLVELIVLNIGLQAKILSIRTFTMFVIMALVTTFATTPLVKWLYPPWYQKKLEAWKRGEIDWDGKPVGSDGPTPSGSAEKLQNTKIRRLLVYLRLDSLPSIFTLVSLLGEEHVIIKDPTESGHGDSDAPVAVRKRPLEVHALRILELTERTSSVMRVTEGGDEYSQRDPVVNAFTTFSQLHDVAVSGSVIVAPEDAYAETVVAQAMDQDSDFVLIPWSEGGSNTVDQSTPFNISSQERFSGKTHMEFIQNTLNKAVCNTGIFIGNGFSGLAPKGKARAGLSRTVSGLSLRSHKEAALPPIADKSHHIFFPFIGGVDDRVALRFVLQLARNPHITATIVHLNWSSEEEDDEITTVQSGTQVPTSPSNLKSSVMAETTAQDSSLLHSLQSSLAPELASRVTFLEVSVTNSSALTRAIDSAKEKVGQSPRNAGDIVVVGRRHSKLPGKQNQSEYDLGKTIGVLGEKMTLGDVKASVLVIQAGGPGLEW